MLVDNLQPLTTSLIDKFGSTIQIQKPSSTSYNPSTGRVETVAGATSTIKAIISNYEANEITGLIQAGDLKVMIDSDTQITKDDKVLYNNKTWNIVTEMPLILQDKKVYTLLVVRV